MRDKSRESENSFSFYEITALPLFAIVFLILSHTYAILIFLIGLKISQHTKFKHHDLHFGFFPTVFSSRGDTFESLLFVRAIVVLLQRVKKQGSINRGSGSIIIMLQRKTISRAITNNHTLSAETNIYKVYIWPRPPYVLSVLLPFNLTSDITCRKQLSAV